MLSRSTLCSGLLFTLGLCASAAANDGPLHAQIDQLISTSALGPLAPQADDATFLRRVTLDLIGRIPTRDEVGAFLADESPDKRQRWIATLLASSEYPRHMAVVFDLMLMERRGGKHVKSEQFREYLEQAFAENRSWQQIAGEILAADGTDEKNRSASAFYLEREVEPNLLTRDVGRIFFGVDLQCAQCHDHPLIQDYHQADYYGLQAFFVRSRLFQEDAKKPALIAEQATGEASFRSVFTEREGMIGPRVPGGEELVAVTLKPDQQYRVPPAKNVREIPAHSRLQQLAQLLANAPPAGFQRNIVNRIWAHMFGRGLVEPVDLAHADNPSTHPELLELLAGRFADSGYDFKWLLEEIALSDTYQRSFQLPELQPSIDDARQRIDAASATAETAQQQSYDADTRVDGLIETLDAAVAEARPLREAESAALKELAEALQARDAEQAKVTKRQQQIEQAQSQAAAITKALEATAAAAELLKGDKELASALATVQKRADVQTESIKKQQVTLESEQAALGTAEQTHQQISKKADEAIAARAPLEEKVRALRGELQTGRAEAEQLRTQAALARRDVASLTTFVDLGESQQQITQLAQAIEQHRSEIAAGTEALGKAEVELAAQQSALQAAPSEFAAQQQKQEAAAAALQSIQQTRAELADAVGKTRSALEQLSQSESLAQAVALLDESLGGVDDMIAEAQSALESEQAVLKSLKTKLDTATMIRAKTEQTLATLQEQTAALTRQQADDQQALAAARLQEQAQWNDLIEQSTARGNVYGLSPLTPEQLALSMLVASGQYDRLRAAAETKVEKQTPLTEESAHDPAVVQARRRQIDQVLAKSLAGPISTFVKLYGAEAGQPQQEFFATAEQSMFAANGNDIRGWLQPADGNLTARLAAQDDNESLARELYLSVLSRPAAEEEVADVAAYLGERLQQKQDAVQELAWGLLTSVEFRFRH
jgi:hypothetical protein